MTDQPEPICGPSCTPDCGMGHCYLENGPYRDQPRRGDRVHIINAEMEPGYVPPSTSTFQQASDPDGRYDPPAPEHAHKPNDQAGEHALRDRIAEALIDDFRQRHGEPDQIIHDGKHRTAALAMGEVQPVLDAKDAEIKRLRSRERIANQHARRTDAERAEADARTARAEARYAELEAMYLRSVADLTERAEDAEREAARLRTHHQQIGDQ